MTSPSSAPARALVRAAALLLGVLVGLGLLALPAQAATATYTISGRVTNADGGAAAQGVTVRAYHFDNAGTYHLFAGRNYNVTTGVDGRYTLRVPAKGDYTVSFGTDPDDGFVAQYWQNKASLAASSKVVLTNGAAAGVDAVIARTGSLVGKVTLDGGTASDRVGFAAVLYSQDDDGDWTVEAARVPVKASTGGYQLTDVPVGDYRLGFAVDGDGWVGRYWDGTPTGTPDIDVARTITVVVRDPSQPAPRADQTLPKAGAVSGTVTAAATGKPLAGVVVQVLEDDADADLVATATTSKTGAYTVKGLDAVDYRLRFVAPAGYASEYFSGAHRLADSTVVTPVLGGVVTGKNADLDVAGTLTGTATLPAGATDKVSRRVTAYDAETGEEAGTGLVTNGAYTLSLPAGSYRLVFAGDDGITPTARVVRDGPFVVTSGGSTTVPSVTLPRGGAVSGTITTNDAGKALACEVVADPPADSGLPQRSGLASTTGAFTIGGLSPEVGYTVTFNESGTDCLLDRPEQYYATASTTRTSEDASAASLQTVPLGTTTALDPATFVLGTLSAPKPTIAGKVKLKQKLTAVARDSDPEQDKITYQWLRNGVAIKGAVKSTYVVTSSDVGKAITVQATWKARGYVTLRDTSVPAAK